MKEFDIDASGVILIGDSGSCIGWGEIIRQYDSSYRFQVLVEFDWCKARVEVETDQQSIQNFLDKLRQLLNLEIDNVYFSAGNGIYEMTLKRETRGNVIVSGTLSKSLLDDSQLIYQFETYLAEIDTFAHRLEKLLIK